MGLCVLELTHVLVGAFVFLRACPFVDSCIFVVHVSVEEGGLSFISFC